MNGQVNKVDELTAEESSARIEKTASHRSTLADVAKRAHVSLSTASKAVNGRPDVRSSTRDRILEVAEQLSFVPPHARRRTELGNEGQVGSVGLLTSDLMGRFSNPILRGAEDTFGSGRVSVFLCDARDDSIREQHYLRALIERGVYGIIVVGSRPDPRPSLGSNLPVPLVYAYAPSRDSNDISVVSDNVGAGRLVVQHLLGMGRRKIAFIAGDSDYGASHDRILGATAVLAEEGLEPISPVRYGAWSESWGRDATAAIVDQHPDVDGIVCGSDQIARGALDTLRDLKLDVPGQIAVTGHDNWHVLALDARPPLTTVDMRMEELGRVAARKLFDAVAGRPEPGVEAVPTRVVPRGSTGFSA